MKIPIIHFHVGSMRGAPCLSRKKNSYSIETFKCHLIKHFYEFWKKKKCSSIKKMELVPWLYTLLTAQLGTLVALIILQRDILVIIIIHLVKISYYKEQRVWLSVPHITFFKKLSVFWLWLGVVTKAGARSLWWISTINRDCSSLSMATCYTSRAEF